MEPEEIGEILNEKKDKQDSEINERYVNSPGHVDIKKDKFVVS